MFVHRVSALSAYLDSTLLFFFFFPVQSKPARPAAAEGDKSDGNRDPAAHQDVQED